MTRWRQFGASPGCGRWGSPLPRRQIGTDDVRNEDGGPSQFCNGLAGFCAAPPLRTALDAAALRRGVEATTYEVRGRPGRREQQLQNRRDVSPKLFVIRPLQILSARGPHLQVYAIEGAEVGPSASKTAVN